jgi:hypothetical protein|tara:strand:- start:44 stop:202 length:159 start_codon:yes stop_codon:yes gene_type:complete
MEDKREFFDCEYCGGSFTIDSDCSMTAEYCVFCSEPLDITQTEEPVDFYEEV